MQLMIIARVGVTPHSPIGTLAQEPFHAGEELTVSVELGRIDDFGRIHWDQTHQ